MVKKQVVMDPFFGIAKLDADLNGLPPKKTAIFSASPSVGNEIFGYQMLYNNLVKGKKILLFLNRTSPQSYDTDLKTYDFEGGEGLTIIDSYSNITGIKPEAGKNVIVVNNPYDREEVKKKIVAEVSKGYDLVLFDSLSLLIDFFDFDYAISLVKEMKDVINKSGASGTFLFTEWDYDKKHLKALFDEMDAQIEIKGIEKRVIFGQYFAVIKCNWAGERAFSSVLFKVIKPGGIRVYVPKILVTGPTDAGKTSLIHTASVNAVSVDRLGGTIALDHGTLDFEGYIADLFGTPGQERFDPLLQMLGGEAIGVVLIVDSTRPEQFPRAIEMLRKTETFGLPIVVVANKADLKGALPIGEIKERLHLGNIPILPTVAVDLSHIDPNEPTQLNKEQVEAVFRALFKQLK